MAKITFPGLNDYELMISRLAKSTEDVAGRAIYAGAGVVADAIRQNISGLPEKTGVTKRGLEEGLGISPLQNDGGYVNVKIGFDGYNANGVANVMMARIFESGTSTVPKQPFVRPAVNRTREQAEAVMAEVLDEEIKKIMEDAE